MRPAPPSFPARECHSDTLGRSRVHCTTLLAAGAQWRAVSAPLELINLLGDLIWSENEKARTVGEPARAADALTRSAVDVTRTRVEPLANSLASLPTAGDLRALRACGCGGFMGAFAIGLTADI